MDEGGDEVLADALVSITSEGGTTWTLSDTLAQSFAFKQDLTFEFSKDKRADGNRTSYIHLLFGRLSRYAKDEATHYHCGVESCTADSKILCIWCCARSASPLA